MTAPLPGACLYSLETRLDTLIRDVIARLLPTGTGPRSTTPTTRFQVPGHNLLFIFYLIAEPMAAMEMEIVVT